ncbi:hypothetical protein NFI96_008273 [Prochilodus magdalenae]|nr:hypothetical protein NFI96_008273 [Prochilodus magdalenae]
MFTWFSTGLQVVVRDAGVSLGVVFNDVYAASKFAVEGLCECLAVQLLRFNIILSMIEPGPVHTEFEMKMIEDVSQKEYPGADSETIHYFKNVYLPSSVDVFQTLGQRPDDIAKCTKKVIEASHPRFRNLTNTLYTPIVALKMADETGGLSVRSFYNMLFNMGGLMHVSMTALKAMFRDGNAGINRGLVAEEGFRDHERSSSQRSPQRPDLDLEVFVFYRVEVRTLCRPVQFLHTRLAPPCLYGACSVHWCAVMLEQEGAVPKLSPQSWKHGMVQSLFVN